MMQDQKSTMGELERMVHEDVVAWAKERYAGSWDEMNMNWLAAQYWEHVHGLR